MSMSIEYVIFKDTEDVGWKIGQDDGFRLRRIRRGDRVRGNENLFCHYEE